MTAKNFDFTKRIKDIINAPLPPEIIQERDAGKSGALSYVSGAYVIDTLNLAFGEGGWEWVTTNHWIQESQPKFNQYSKVPEDQKVMHNGKKGAWEEQAPVCHVAGILTIRFYNDQGDLIEKKVSGFGSKSIIGGQSEQEHIFKAASTDAMKKAASQLGVAGELYRKEAEQSLYDRMSFASTWSEKDKEENQHLISYVKQILGYYAFNRVTFAPYVQAFDSSLQCINDITPANIKAFAEYLQGQFAE